MKTIIICSLLLFSVFGFSQKISFPESNATWVQSVYVEDWSAGNPIPQMVFAHSFSYCMGTEDTIINTISYNIVDSCNGSYKGAIRNDAEIVYFIPKDSLNEFILYDFSANLGDTIHDVYYEENFSTPRIEDFIISQVDSVQIGGFFYKISYFQFGGNWIESIGASHGLFQETKGNISQYDIEFTCMSNEDTIYYPSYNFGSNSCVLNLSVSKKEKQLFSLSPNPTTSKINIQTEQPLYNAMVTIYNLQGKQVIKTQLQNNTVDMSELESGMYLLEIDAEGRREVHKVRKG